MKILTILAVTVPEESVNMPAHMEHSKTLLIQDVSQALLPTESRGVPENEPNTLTHTLNFSH